MVAIEALTGSHPTNFIDENSVNPVWRDRIPTSTRNYNPNLLNLLDRMVRSNHQERYQSVPEVLKDLDRIDLTISRNLTPFPEEIERPGDKTVPDIITPKSKKSLLPWLIAGLGAVTLAIAGSLFIGNSEKYADYTNAEYGIDLERPENWSVQESWMSLQPGVTFLSPLANQKRQLPRTGYGFR